MKAIIKTKTELMLDSVPKYGVIKHVKKVVYFLGIPVYSSYKFYTIP